ncbi:phage tail assembly chaperone [Solilutibacter silvestris]|uniref:phage tail assembly chaperone n=1 Tax=Solilutibacter silvestris TaxID=1645665 RepID=UPI003D3291DF
MDFNIGSNTYRSGKMDAMKQLHVARRLAPFIGQLVGVSDKNLITRLTEAASKLSDEDCDYVIKSCMAVTKRQQGDAWSPVMNGAGFQFDDIDLQAMLQIASHVLQDNLSGFFSGIVQASPAAGTTEQASAG